MFFSWQINGNRHFYDKYNDKCGNVNCTFLHKCEEMNCDDKNCEKFNTYHGELKQNKYSSYHNSIINIWD